MSDNWDGRVHLDSEQFRTADALVNSILDDLPSPTSLNRTLRQSVALRRALDTFGSRSRLVRAHDLLGNSISVMDDDFDDSDRDLRRRFNRDPPSINASSPHSSGISSNPPFLPPLRSLGSPSRTRMATPSGPSARPSRYRPSEPPPDRRNSEAPARVGHGITGFQPNFYGVHAHYSTRERAGTTRPDSPPPAMLSVSSPLHGNDSAEENRRVKRRKLDSDRPGSNFKGFHYGKYGQVEPGPLKMEIVSCDGGLFSDELLYPPENILKNDGSVYCTKGNRCNIVLQHQGGTVFSIKELTIKAPGSSYSCPVREGMVFVTMKSDEVFKRTTDYQIEYSSRPRPPVYSIRHEDDGVSTTRIRPPRSFTLGIDDDEDYRVAQVPAEFTVQQSEFKITTECTDEDSDADDDQQRLIPPHLRASRRRTPNRIGALPFESGVSSDDDGDAWGQSASDWPVVFDDLIRRPHREARRNATSGAGSGMTLEEAVEASQLATQEAVRSVGGELMKPLAHFSIQRDKNKCTISFDPPVSGRYILLKMWNPTHHDSTRNIDIQAVVVKGFAGPRYFPSVELA
ncbi:hypothetical protein QBC38DRAFT_464351 [Podospora fimiseda]|uniref:Eukaryotic translation initiation factor 6 n=1 Tax=Podospora fimiseda TaxID=252190 RepID=A0AAN7BYQ8_9PEZI|nr:hypothetical protein QBC38DRAFT_464351 [Podospora fimiseda]